MSKALGVLALSALALSLAPTRAAENICNVYDNLKSTQRAGLLDLKILKPEGSTIGILILGNPKSLRVTANGLNISSYKVNSEEIICSRVRAGEIAYYDLSPLKLDAAFIEAADGQVKAAASVSFSR